MKRIVVGIDGSEGSRRALEFALDEARLSGASVTVVHAWSFVVASGLPYAYPADEPNKFGEAARELMSSTLAAANTDGVEVETSVVCGGPAESLINAAKGADLLVVGSRGRGGFSQLLLGSVSQQVTHHAPCPVVIVPSPKD